MNTSDVLNRAADLIEAQGWTKGNGWAEEGREGAALCLEGGIMAALGMRPAVICDEELRPLWTCPAYEAVSAYLDRDCGLDDGEPRQTLYHWNDGYDRTASDVIEVLRACALIEAAREEQDAAWATYAEQVSA